MKHKNMLFAPDTGAPDGGGDASGAGTAPNVWQGHDTPAPAVDPPATAAPAGGTAASAPESPAIPGPAPVQPASSPPQSDWTPERVAELLRAAREPSVAAAQPPQMSEDEMNRLLNVATVTQDDVQGLLEGGENAVAVMQKMIQAAVLQARTTAWYQTQMLLKQQQESLSPVISHYQQQQQEQLTQQFFGAHKEFTPEKHMKLLAAVKSSLDAEQAFHGKSREQGFALIAERAKELLTASGTPLVPVGAPQSGAPQMAQLSRGAGHGAAAANAGGGASSNTAKRFFG